MTRSLRSAYALGLAITIAAATWWLGATRLVLSTDSPVFMLADQAIAAALIARALIACAFLPPAASRMSTSTALQSGLLLVAVAWPLTALCWLAGSASAASIAWSEIGLLLVIAALVALGRLIGRSINSQGTASAVAGSLGLLLACAAWLSRDHWLILGVPS